VDYYFETENKGFEGGAYFRCLWVRVWGLGFSLMSLNSLDHYFEAEKKGFGGRRRLVQV
jgi:hypothetical protein